MKITEFVELFGDVESTALTPINRGAQVLDELESIHAIAFPKKEKFSFFENVFLKMLESEIVTTGEIFVRHNGKSKVPIPFLNTLLPPCGFVVGAIKAEKDGRHEEAWSQVCDATYWLAVLKTSILSDKLTPTSINSVATAGGKGRDALYEPLRDLANKLAQEKNFKSRRNAAMSIAPQIINRSKELGLNMSEAQAPITISGWLKDKGFGGKRNT